MLIGIVVTRAIVLLDLVQHRIEAGAESWPIQHFRPCVV
jgi:multidrug efflux pump subunit AcrB